MADGAAIDPSRTGSHPDIAGLRRTCIDGRPWFAAADVAKMFGLGRTNQAVELVDPAESRITPMQTSSSLQAMRVLSFAGILEVAQRSRGDVSDQFARWSRRVAAASWDENRCRTPGGADDSEGVQGTRPRDVDGSQLDGLVGATLVRIYFAVRDGGFAVRVFNDKDLAFECALAAARNLDGRDEAVGETSSVWVDTRAELESRGGRAFEVVLESASVACPS